MDNPLALGRDRSCPFRSRALLRVRVVSVLRERERHDLGVLQIFVLISGEGVIPLDVFFFFLFFSRFFLFSFNFELEKKKSKTASFQEF